MLDEAPNDDSPVELCFGSDCFQSDAIRSCKFAKRLEDNHIVASSSAVVTPPVEARWDYHAEAVLLGPEGLKQKGICVKAEPHPDGSIEFSIQGATWEFERSFIKGFETFGMSNEEIAYWLPLLTGLVRGVEIPGLILDDELRPFVYAVPLQGLSAEGLENKILHFKDFGVIAGEDDLFAPLLARSQLAKERETVWQADTPKAWGIVAARDFREAESLALSRAQFTADLINFALSTGISHFQTRCEAELLDWNADVGRSVISLQPWIMLRETKAVKGWIRAVPLIERRSEINLEDGYERIKFFADRFIEASQEGDAKDQAGRRTLSYRERKLLAGIQRSLRWLGVAANENSDIDQFIAAWIALESVLSSIDYPGVFEGDRRAVRNSIERGVAAMELPKTDGLLVISDALIRNRVLQSQWPLRTKLVMFAKACGVELRPGDLKLVSDLQRLRSQVFHGGRNDPSVSKEQLRRLQYLIGRLVVAASVCGYEDLEEDSDSRHQLQFGKIGPEGGAAPLFLNGREVSYTLRVSQDEEGQQAEGFVMELTIEGKIYSSKNADISFIGS